MSEKKDKKSKSVFSLKMHIIVTGIVLMLAGIFLAIGAVNMSRDQALEEKKIAFSDLAASIDKNMDNIASRINNQLYYTYMNPSFREAEERFLEHESQFELWSILRNNTMFSTDFISGMVGTMGNRIVISSHDDLNGTINIYDSMGNYSIELCSVNKKYYLAFKFNGYTDRIQYYALVDLDRLYSQVTDTEIVGANRVLLYSEKLNFVITPTSKNVTSYRMIDFMIEGNRELGDLLMSYSNEGVTTPRAEIIEYRNNYGRNIAEFLTFYPSKLTNNGIFSVVVLTDYDAIMESFMMVNYSIIMSLSVFFTGLCVVVIGIIQMRQIHKQNEIELAIMRQRNELLQEQIDKTKELEHAQRMELLGTMTSGIAHEFNNLLTPIMAYSLMSLEIIADNNTDLSDNIIEIYNASKKAKEIIKRISELSKKTSPSTFEVINADDFMRRMVSITHISKKDNISINEVYLAGDKCFYANETQMTQVFLNIIINAFSAIGDKEGGNVTITSIYDEDSDYIKVSIKDNGKGISDKDLEQIFTPFFTTKEEGTGLGLAIASNIIDTLGGAIEVKSQLGEGTIFTVSIPAYHGDI